MDEMTAFEDRLVEDARRVAGPRRGVDAAAVFAAISASQSPWVRLQSALSATKVVFAGVIVALFGGFLLVSLTGERQADPLPAAATRTPMTVPSPTTARDSGSFITTAELVAKLVTEEVEPGVLRVLDDHIDEGRGIERRVEGIPSMFVDVGPDGGVWLSGGGGQGDLFQLGDVGSYEDAGSGATASSGGLEVGPDGSFWAHDGGIVRRFIDDVWTSWQLEDGLETTAIAVDQDGVPWVLASKQTWGDERIIAEESTVAYRLLTLTPAGTWTQFEVPFDLGSGYDWRWLEAAPDGSLWLSGGQVRAPDGTRSLAMLRFDGVEWELVDVPGGDGDTHGLGIGPDGELWREFVDPAARLDLDPDPERQDLSGDWIGLARLDEDGWTTFGAADGVGSWGQGVLLRADRLEVGPDGKVWVNAARHVFDCGGVASFDGVEWKPYLEGRCVHDLAVAPDGGVWVRADLDGFEGTVGTYVIITDGQEGQDR